MRTPCPGFVPLAALLALALTLPACAGEDVDEDGIDDVFLGTDGKEDSVFGVAEGSPDAVGVLRVASEASRDTLASSSGVRLGSTTANAIVKARVGADGASGTADDVIFATLAELDRVPYVGPKAFEKLLAYARAHGFVTSPRQLAGQARRVPWSGYWWSMERGELVLGWSDGRGRQAWSEAQVRAFDGCLESYARECVSTLASMAGADGARLSPLMKFDLYVRRTLEEQYGPGGAPASYFSHAARWELENHYIGDDTGHRYWDSRGYAGKCIGWALSTFDYDEPTRDVVLRGIRFRPADIKGFLASIYNGAQFFVPEELSVGNAFHENPDSDSPEFYEDVHPHDFVRALLATLGRGEMLEGDLEPGDGVWNYPVYRFELAYDASGGPRVPVSARIFYANDEVGIDDVFTTDPERTDLLSRDLTFELEVPVGWSGDLLEATSGRWTGAAVDTHPDALILGLEEGWRKTIYEYSGTDMKLEVNYPLIKRLRFGGTWKPVIDVLLADYYASR